jgi:hypothetical protein
MSKSSTQTASITNEQIAELTKLRAEKEIAEALAKTEQETPELKVADSAPQEEEFSFGDKMKMQMLMGIMKLAEFSSGLEGVSTKRKLAAFFGSILVSGAAGYAIGSLAGYAIAGVMALGGSVLWAYLILIIALILGAYAGMKIGQHVGNYILSGKIDKDIVAAKNKFLGFFKSKPLIVAGA